MWRVHLNNALNALAEDFTEVVNMLESSGLPVTAR